MQTISLRVDDIEVGGRHRALSNDAVARLATSLKDVGLIQPISVRVVEEMVVDGELTAGVPLLVAGRHRLAAARKLGWSHIDCIEVDDDAIKAELVEIAENLHRCDLTKEQRDEHIRRYAELIAAQRSTEKPDKKTDFKEPGAGRGNKGIATEIAEASGLSQRTVRRALNPPAPKPVIAPVPIHEEDATERQVAALMSAWNRASRDARDEFLSRIDGPVFDQTRAGAA